MSFVDFKFYVAAVCLFIVVELIQIIFQKKQRISNLISKLLILAFSYLVMGLYDVRFCICMTGVILFTWMMGILIDNSKEKSAKPLTVVAVAVLVATLGIFKYLNFFMETASRIIGKPWAVINIILPVGISFYIFSAIGYILDVSWKKIHSEQSLMDMALFLSFFPKQVCGPIVNARDFLPQLKENRKITINGLEKGLQIFVFGFLKKMVLANHLGVFVDDVFYSPVAYGTATLWLAVFSYFLQLYLDFSGYSDMAIGISKIFGYDINRNFNFPFLALNISDFWDRWHISLSAWLNEYIFNPIAIKLKRMTISLPKEKRKRYKNMPTYIATLITFLISGLWHGAGFTFLIWGMLHGIISIIHGIYSNWMHKNHRSYYENKPKVILILNIALNFIVLSLINVFFRAESITQAIFILRRMFSINTGIEQPYTWAFVTIAILLISAIGAWIRSNKLGLKKVEGYYPIFNLDTLSGLIIFFTFSGLSVMLAYFGENYFIYGNF